MASFKDSTGRTWTIRVTPYSMRKVRDFADINLGTIFQNDMAGLIKLMGDDVDLCCVLWALCEDEADKRKVTIKDFMESIVDDVIEDASQAFLEGLQEMYPPKRAPGLELLIRVLKTRNESIAQELEKYSTQLTGKDTPTAWEELCTWTLRTLRARNCT